MLGVAVAVCVVCGCERVCAVGKLYSFEVGADRNVVLDKVVVMYVGVGLVMGLQKNIGG